MKRTAANVHAFALIGAQTMQTPARSKMLFLKVALSLTVVTVLIVRFDWQTLPNQLNDYRWEFAALAFAGLLVQFPLSGLKWRAALHVCNVDLSFGLLTRFYCIAHFVGQFLPTSIGGDAYRIYRVLPLVAPRSRAVSSIVLDRVIGLGALLCLGAAGAVTLIDEFWLPRSYLAAIGVGTASALLGAAALYVGWLGLIRKKIQHHKWIVALREDCMQLLRAGWRWVPLIFLAFLFQTVAVTIVYLLFVGAGSSIGFAEVALISAVTGVVGMIPLSINGLGITEGSIALAGVALGADYEDAVIAAMLLRVTVMPLSMACGVLYCCEPNTQEARAVAPRTVIHARESPSLARRWSQLLIK